MIGNDVVDLALASTQSNWKRKGYLDKVFTNLEQEFISKSLNPNEMVWSLWSRKEAVYKIIIQKNGKRGYYPKKIKCLDTDYENGIVTFESTYFYTKTKVTIDSIHSFAIVNKKDFGKIKAITNFENLIKKDGIPFYKLDSKLYAATKSHHGRFEKSFYLQS